MLHRESAFSPREQQVLRAVAVAVMPHGRRVPGADDRCIRTFETYVANLGDTAIQATRAMLTALDAEAYARRLRPFAKLTGDKQRDILESWRTGGYVRRTAMRALLTPLKMAHFDDPQLFRQLG